MKVRFYIFPVVYIVFSVAFILSCSHMIFAAEDTGASSTANTGVTTDVNQSEKPAGFNNKEEIEQLEKLQAQAQEEIKKKEVAVESVKKEAAQVIEEKNIIEKEAALKEKAALVAKEELAVVKQEAAITQDPEAIRKAQELEAEAKQREKEAALGKEKLKVAETKALVAQETVAANQAAIESLKKAFLDLKKEKTAKRSWLEKSLTAMALILVGVVLFFLLTLVVKRIESLITKKDVIREKEITLRIKTMNKLVHWLGSIIIVSIVAYMVLENFGLDVAPLLAGAGIVGLAFGFGGQYLIRDVINGFFILVEGQYRVNDVVKIGDLAGLVEDINLRITTLRDLEGRVIIIPNGEIKSVINYTREYAQALFDIGVAYKENVDQVMEVIRGVGQEMREDKYFGRLILDDLEMFGVDDFGASQVTIKFRIKTLPIKQWEVMREFRRRLKNRFDELGIEIPFPHRTIYWGTGEDNAWVQKFAEQYLAKTSPHK